MAKPLPSPEKLREYLDYDPLTGGLVWKKRPPRVRRIRPGSKAGSLHGRYYKVCIEGVHYAAHRVIWAMVHDQDPGELEVDHIDLDSLNNRIENLRLATVSQNRANCSGKSRSGLPKGVKRNRQGYGARISLNKSVRWLGTFDTPAEAHAAYCAAAAEMHGEFARSA